MPVKVLEHPITEVASSQFQLNKTIGKHGPHTGLGELIYRNEESGNTPFHSGQDRAQAVQCLGILENGRGKVRHLKARDGAVMTPPTYPAWHDHPFISLCRYEQNSSVGPD